MTTKLIKTTSEYEAAKRRAASLVGLDPVAGTPEADELEVLAFLLADYENTFVSCSLSIKVRQELSYGAGKRRSPFLNAIFSATSRGSCASQR